MALPLVFNNVVYPAGYFGTDDGGATASTGLDATYNFPVTVNGTINKVGDTVTVTYTLPGATTPTVDTVTSTRYDNTNMIEFISTNGVPGNEDGSTNRYFFSNIMMYGNPPPTGQTRTRFVADANDTTLNDYTINPPVCFARGTLILVARETMNTDVAVEDLRIGDLVVTASGAHRPIRWIGTRSYSGVFARRNPHVLPVTFAAGSLGDNVPARDLVVSPKHAMVIDGMLVPAESLVNGRTITKAERIDSVEYFHVELDSHDVLIAEGAASESYVEDDNRNFFHNVAEYRLANPDAASIEAVYCLPRVEDGFALEAIRQRLAERADALLGALPAVVRAA